MENDATVDAAGSDEDQDEIAVQPEADGSAPSQSDATDETPAKKSGGGFQKRIETLTRRNYETAQERDAAKREVEELRQKLQAREQPADSKDAPKGDGRPKEEDFTDYNAYLRADARYEAQEAAREVAKQEREAAARERVESTTREQVSRRQQDFAVAVERLGAQVPDFERVANSAHVSHEVGQALLASDKGAAVVYFLGANPEEAFRIAQESRGDPVRAAIEIARLESRAEALIQQRTRSGASKQSPPLGAGGRSVAGEPSMKDDIKDWIDKRRKQVHG